MAVDVHSALTGSTSHPVEPSAGPPPPLVVDRWRPSPRGVQARIAVMVLLALVVLVIPAIVPAIYTPLVARAAVYAVVAISLNILIGYAGQVSLGHAAFFGVGAFASGYTLTELQLPWVIALVVAAAIGALAAILLGAVALRVRGLYLALITIAYGLFAQFVVFNISELTGGGGGMFAPRPAIFSGDVVYAYLCIAFMVLALLFDWRLAGSKAGRAIRALRDDERVAASWGINVTSYKLMAFVLSGAIASIAGALFAGIEEVVAPPDFEFTLSLTFLLMTVVGGAGNRFGVVQGGILFAILPTLLELLHGVTIFGAHPFGFITATLEPVIAAILLVLTLALFPGGIAQQQEHLHRWLAFGRFHAHPEDDPLSHPPAVRRAGESAFAEPASSGEPALSAAPSAVGTDTGTVREAGPGGTTQEGSAS